MNGIDKQRILRRIANMSDDDKDSHIQMVEITIDYGFGSTLSDEDIAIYKILWNLFQTRQGKKNKLSP